MLDNIKYFIEDYWKWIIAVIVILLLALTSYLLFMNNNDRDNKNKEQKNNNKNKVVIKKINDKIYATSQEDKDEKLKSGDEYTIDEVYRGIYTFNQNIPNDNIKGVYKQNYKKYKLTPFKPQKDENAYKLFIQYIKNKDEKITCLDSKYDYEDCFTQLLSEGKVKNYNYNNKNYLYAIKNIDNQLNNELNIIKQLKEINIKSLNKKELQNYSESLNYIETSTNMKKNVLKILNSEENMYQAQIDYSTSNSLNVDMDKYIYSSLKYEYK